MLTTQFILVNYHFVASLLAALVAFAVAWLYFDAWTGQKDPKQFPSFLGFLFLSLSFVAQAVIGDQSLFETSFLGASTALVIKTLFRLIGYVTLIVGQVLIPLQSPPTRKRRSITTALIPFLAIPAAELIPFFLPPL